MFPASSHPGVAGAEGSEEAGDHVGADSLGRGQRDAAAVSGMQVGQRADGLARHGQQAGAEGQQRLAGLRQPRRAAARSPHHQRAAECLIRRKPMKLLLFFGIMTIGVSSVWDFMIRRHSTQVHQVQQMLSGAQQTASQLNK